MVLTWAPAALFLPLLNHLKMFLSGTQPSFIPTREHFCNHIREWEDIYNSKEPHNMKLPESMDKTLNELQKIIILRCLRPDKVENRFEIQTQCSL